MSAVLPQEEPSPLPKVSNQDQAVTDEASDEISLLDLLLVLAKRKWLVIGTTMMAVLIAVVVALLTTPIYTASARLLMPQNQGAAASAMLSQALGGAAGLAGSALGLKNPADQYIALLKSRTVAERLITQFDLRKRYKGQSLEDAVTALAGRTKVAAGKDGIISIDIDDEDPKFAADLANAYIPALEWLTQRLAVSETGQRRVFFEQQLKAAHEQLAQAENAMKAAQKKTGFIQLDAQANAMLKAVADMRAQVAVKEVELAAMRSYATENNPDFVRALRQLEAMRDKLRVFEGRARPGADEDLPFVTSQMPETGLFFARTLRELKYRETLYELLAKQYEMARLEEAKDSLVIQVLDKALPPEHRSKPKRSQMVLLAGLAGLMLGVLAAFVREAGEKARQDPLQAQRWALLRGYLWGRRNEV